MSNSEKMQRFIAYQKKQFSMSRAIAHDDMITAINLGKPRVEQLELQSLVIRLEVLLLHLDNGRFENIPFWQNDFHKFEQE